jgi:hypothetical protein
LLLFPLPALVGISPQVFCDRFHGTKTLRDKLGTVWRHDATTCVRCSRSKFKSGP